MDPVTHFEMPAKDKKRAAAFYANVFGWQMQQLGPEMGDYLTAGTVEVDAQRVPRKPGAINGGFYTPTADTTAPSVVITVKDIRATMKAIEKAGGKVLRRRPVTEQGGRAMEVGMGEPDVIPGVGLWVSFLDSEGNRASLIQPL